MLESSIHDLHSLSFPFLAFGRLELAEAFLSQLMLAEGKGPYIVVLEHVHLQRFKVLSLHKQLCNLGLHSHGMQVRDESVADISLSLLLPLAYAQVLHSADLEKLIKWSLDGQVIQAMHEHAHCDGLLWSGFQGVEMSAHQGELVVIQCHVRLVEHFLFLNTLLPCADCTLEHIKLALIPGSILGLVALASLLYDSSEKPPGAAP